MASLGRALIHARAGNLLEAKKILDAYDEPKRIKGEDYRGLGLVYLTLGDHDKAIEALIRSINDHELSMSSLQVDPKLDSLRPDPRFNQLIKKMGFKKENDI